MILIDLLGQAACARRADATRSATNATDRNGHHDPLNKPELAERVIHSAPPEHVWIHDVDRFAARVGDDLVEDVPELDLVFLTRDVSDVRRADDVLHLQQRMAGIAQRLFFDRHRRPPCPVARCVAPPPAHRRAINCARLVFTSNAVGFIRARSSAVTMPRVASTSRMCSETMSHVSKNAALLEATA